MSSISILYGLSGSEQSKFAAEVAWDIANCCNGTVTAHHVIDTRTIWELLRNDKPGLIGSSAYVDAYANLCDTLRSIANKLAEKYEAMAAGRSLKGDTIIAEGNPITLIADVARGYDLVVVGHQPRGTGGRKERRSFIRYAVAEGLAHECPRPLLVIQSQVKQWNSLTVLISMDHINYSLIEACLDFAGRLGITPKVVALSSGVREESAADFTANLRKAVKGLDNVAVESHAMEGVAVDDHAALWPSEELNLEWYPDPDTLLVIPTRRSGEERLTVLDTTPDLFVANLGLPSILLWPEEHVEMGKDGDVREAVRASGK
ncbi:MAG: universal stress protein [Candidatus Obscuribacterales bacterium]